MFDKIPNFIDPIYFTHNNKQISGIVNQKKFSRLQEHLVYSLEYADRSVEIEAKFLYDKALKFPAIEFFVSSLLRIKCQRSLETFDFKVEASCKGVFVDSLEFVKDLPRDIEAYNMVNDKVSLYDIIEDELLLALPISPIKLDSVNSWQESNSGIILKESEKNICKKHFLMLKSLNVKKD